MKNRALVVIDLQNDITKHYREIIDRVNQAIDWAVGQNMYVVYIQHNNLFAVTRTFKPGTRGAELVPEMKIVSDTVFTKTKGNALTSEDFAGFIQENGITEFLLQARMPRPVSNPPATIWRKAGIPFMYCLTASPATTKSGCPRCLRIMKARDARSRSFMRLWKHNTYLAKENADISAEMSAFL